MRTTTSLAIAAAALLAAPAAAQNTDATANYRDMNVAVTNTADANVLSGTTTTTTNTTTATDTGLVPVTGDNTVAETGYAAPVPEKKGFPWGVVGLAAFFGGSALLWVFWMLGWHWYEARGTFQPGDYTPRQREVETALRDALGGGLSLDEAVRLLHETRGYELTFLWPAVVSVGQMPQSDAMRLVVRATAGQPAGAS